ncbi:hypothetical protein EVAR_45548_1 [Eumeta japonica]|uniref:PDZ domain-containing protein n=1 Tax=Eumeta variegata TaxID=151549 RepID=A0A4C1X6F5_EUMVA|nr:hypothetical protein EVAR_45548_1 [Eumeta japonica]
MLYKQRKRAHPSEAAAVTGRPPPALRQRGDAGGGADAADPHPTAHRNDGRAAGAALGSSRTVGPAHGRSRRRSRPGRSMATVGLSEEFVTIVPVGEGRPVVPDSSFVTVLTVGSTAGAAEVLVHRPRGARLGLGLKFEGGSAAAEKVRRLLVQSCAENSPAASASTPWGNLIPGDEILAIDNVAVSDLTRIDCVRRLKDSDETLKLLVRHFETNNENKSIDTTNAEQLKNQSTEIARPNCLPPPVPPRKLGKKNSFKERPTFQTVGDQTEEILKQVIGNKDLAIHGSSNALTTIKLSRKSSFDSHLHRQNKEGIAYLKRGSPEEVRRLVRRLSDGKAMPPEAEVYIDLLSTDWERCLALADAESDDTGSSISTVVDRLGSMTNSVENSIPSTPVLQPKTIDIHKVLNCIENIDSDILKDMTITKIQEMKTEIKNEMKPIENLPGKTQDLTAEILPLQKETTLNDKNNNNTIIRNITCINIDVKESKNNSEKINALEPALIKPKPMPRINKSDWTADLKKPKELSFTDNTKTVPDTLLTPTKKNCIETWLQHSEAEMNHNGSEVTEEILVPEALPRLIDFVPKTQFKECSNETKARPTTQPPPPPTEVREDGSGASLDTIGELDESGDVVDSSRRRGTRRRIGPATVRVNLLRSPRRPARAGRPSQAPADHGTSGERAHGSIGRLRSDAFGMQSFRSDLQ